MNDFRSIAQSEDAKRALLEKIEKVETICVESNETLLVGVARCAWMNHQEIGEMLDFALPQFKQRIIIYPSDELEFKKLKYK